MNQMNARPSRAAQIARDIRFTIVMLVICLSPIFIAEDPFDLFKVRQSLEFPLAVFFSLVLFLVMYWLYLQVRRAEELGYRLAETARTDSLTGLGNRRAFEDALVIEARRSQRQGYALSMLIVDIDEFKMVNDTFGHRRGDTVLQCMAITLRQATREDMDQLYRIGGDEFVVFLPATRFEEAQMVRERVEVLYGEEASRVVPQLVHRCSVGVADYQPGEDPESWFGRADSAMYKEKGVGDGTSREE